MVTPLRNVTFLDVDDDKTYAVMLAAAAAAAAAAHRCPALYDFIVSPTSSQFTTNTARYIDLFR